MKTSKAVRLIKSLDSEDYTFEEKVEAIEEALKMPDVFSKNSFIRMIQFLLCKREWNPYVKTDPETGEKTFCKPAVNETVLVSDGHDIWIDSLQCDGGKCWWDEKHTDPYMTKWMYLPQ